MTKPIKNRVITDAIAQLERSLVSHRREYNRVLNLPDDAWGFGRAASKQEELKRLAGEIRAFEEQLALLKS